MDVTEEVIGWMVDFAKGSAGRAYCPYSKFHVGACLLCENGHFVNGCNVENASYGLTICAERNAVFTMVNGRNEEHYPDGADIKILCVVIYTPTPTPSAPCGACRQVLNEFSPRCRVISVCDGPGRLDTTLDLLLPHSFGPHSLVV